MDVSQRRTKLSKQDVDIARRAKAAAGGSVKLGQLFGVSKQATSEWGRVRPIPRHVRPRLEQLIRQRAPATNESLVRGVEDPPWRSLGSLVAGTDLQLTPLPDERRARKAIGAWHGMTEEQKNVLRSYVRRAALIAAAVQQLLSDDSARKVIATLSTEVSAYLNNELLRFTP